MAMFMRRMQQNSATDHQGKFNLPIGAGLILASCAVNAEAAPTNSDPGPIDSGSVLVLNTVGEIQASTLDYRVREPIDALQEPNRVDIVGHDATGTQYTIQLIVPESKRNIFDVTWDVGGTVDVDGEYLERSAIIVEGPEKHFVSVKGSISLRQDDGGRYTATVNAVMAPIENKDGALLSIDGIADGKWSLSCFALSTGVRNGQSDSGVDQRSGGGEVVSWYLDQSFKSPYCAQYKVILPAIATTIR